MYADRMMGYAMSNAAQDIASKNTAPVYYHEFGYSGNYSVITSSLYYRGLGNPYKNIFYFYLPNNYVVIDSN